MPSFPRALSCFFLANFAAAQVPAPVVRIAPVVVEETLLDADATGLTRVRFDPATPAASRSLGALATRVANLHINLGGAGSFGDTLALRGLPNTPFFSDPSVTVYFDDLPLGSGFTYPTGLLGFASATVRRGPQGTTLARGGEGGALLFSSTEPGPAVGGEARVGAGDFHLRTASIEARSARGEKADVTAAASFLERDGFIRNTTLGRPVDDQESASAASRLRLRPTEASEFTLQLLAHRLRQGAQPLVPMGGPWFRVARGREGRTESSFAGGAFKARLDTAAGRLTSTTSRTAWSLNPYENRLELPPTLDSRITQSQRIWNEELRLASDARSLVAWHVGAWFSDGATEGDVHRAIPEAFPIEASRFLLGSRTTALFAEATFPPNIGWTVTTGLRLEETEREFERHETVPAAARFQAERRFRALQGKLAASYTFANEVTASASLSFGGKPGGWSAYTGNPALAGFAAEKVAALEAGIDGSLANRTISLAARVFAYAIRDYQIERSFTATDYLVVNAPRARSLGVEFEGTWKPLPELTLTAALGVTDVTLRRFTDPFTGRNLAGHRAPYTPDYEAHLGATYRARSGIFVAGEAATTGKTFFDEAESPGAAAGSRTLLHVRTGYETAQWRIALFAENIADESYASLIVPGVGHLTPGAPRTWGVEATIKW